MTRKGKKRSAQEMSADGVSNSSTMASTPLLNAVVPYESPAVSSEEVGLIDDVDQERWLDAVDETRQFNFWNSLMNSRLRLVWQGALNSLVGRFFRVFRRSPFPQFNECNIPFFLYLATATEHEGWLQFQCPPPTKISDRLYRRECYEIICADIIASRERFLITGTPGVGKSMFLYYLLWVLVVGGHRVLYVHQPFMIYFDGQGRVFEVFQLPRASEMRFWNDDLFVLFDAKQKTFWDLGLFPYDLCTFVLSTSPRPDLVNDYKKSSLLELYMPPWSEEEMTILKSAYPHVTNWRYRFDYLGGIPRRVFENRDRSLEQKIARACNNFDPRNLKRLFSIDPVRYDMSFASDLLFHITSDSTFQEPMLQFASRKAFEIFMKIHGDPARREIVGPLLASCHRNVD